MRKGVKKPRPVGWVNPLKGKPGRRIPIEKRLWAKVDKNGAGGCWIFTAKANRLDYGVMWWNGKVVYAHRISWLLAGRKLENGKVLDHICRVPRCVNPAHLRQVTTNENVKAGVSVWAINARKTHCAKGHPFSRENSAYRESPPGKTRHGHQGKAPRRARICLTCFPANWRYAVVKRDPPKRSKLQWIGPASFYTDSEFSGSNT